MKTKPIKSAVMYIAIFIFGNGLLAQSFTKITDSPLVTDNAESEGCAWGDFDNDGDEDLFVTNGLDGVQNNMLFLNEGPDSNYSFNLITEGSIVNDDAASRAASWGDYDNDGNLDLLVANSWKKYWNTFLYHNNGDGTFTKIENTPETKDYDYSAQGGWVDYDNDGNLDILIGSEDVGWALNGLFCNSGNGNFRKVRTGPVANANYVGYAWGDYDNDGDYDLCVLEADWDMILTNNDMFLFDNDGDGNFIIAAGEVIDFGNAGFPNWVDYDNDGDWDLHVPGCGLYYNQGPDSSYSLKRVESENIATNSGISSWADFDNDGDIDCFISTLQMQTNHLYSNNGDGTFTEVTEGEIVTETSPSIACAWADFDNDGDMDLYVCNTSNQNNFFYRNDNDNGNSWIKIKLTGTISNASAIGTKIRVKANTNGPSVWQMRAIEGQSGFMSQNSLIAHFGLGSATLIDSLVVHWTAGHETVMTNMDVNQQLTIIEDIPDGYIKARFITDTTYGPGILTVQFTDMSLTSETDTVNSWSWDFDNDGIEDSNEKNPEYTYSSVDGQYYDVSLTVSNETGTDSVLKKEYIRIYPQNGNLALWGRATASSAYYNLPVFQANDDDLLRGWMSEKIEDTEWLIIELDTIYTVGKVVLHWSSADWRIRHYAILTSLDNTTWDTVYCVSDGTGAKDTLLFTGVDARYVQIFKFPKSDQEIYVREIEIFRSDGETYEPVKCDDETGIENSSLCNLPTRVFPNPTENKISIEFNQPLAQNILIELTDITGRIHKKIELASSSGLSVIDVSGLVNGLYFLSIRFNNRVYNHKIIKY